MITVSKFGGTSVKDVKAIRRLADIIKSKNEKVVVVVSAMAGVTDALIALIENLRVGKLNKAINKLDEIFNLHLSTSEHLKIPAKAIKQIKQDRIDLEQLIRALNVLGEVSPKSYNMIVSTGERLSSFIISEYLKSKEITALHIDSTEIIRTDSTFPEAEVDFKITNKLIQKHLMPIFKKHSVAVCGGFIASDKQGNITTLGRGGSDYSAAIIAAGCEADKLEIWTDVSGIMTVDPRTIKESRIIKELSYKEAAELAYFGAKVLHPKTIQPAVVAEIPVYVLNSYEPKHPGTKIVKQTKNNKIIKALAFRKNITVINISSNRMLGAHGFLGKVFEIFSKYETSVDIVTTSEVSVSLNIDSEENLPAIKRELREIADIDVMKNYGIICAVGDGIRDTSGVAARFFGVLKGINILMVSIGASDVNISIIVKDKDIKSSIGLLHKEFFSGEADKSIFY